MRGNRLVSVFVYLQLPEAGGRTAFPQLQQSFQPRAGGALVWYTLDRHGTPDERTLHAGEPVARGEKWGMNIWLRERAFPRRAWPRVRLALPLLPGGAVRAQLAVTAPPAVARGGAAPEVAPRCGVCGSAATPLGLCLCQAQYA